MLKGERQYCPSRGQELQVFLLPQRQQPHLSPCRGLPGAGEPSETARLFSGVAGSAVSERPHKAGLQPGVLRIPAGPRPAGSCAAAPTRGIWPRGNNPVPARSRAGAADPVARTHPEAWRAAASSPYQCLLHPELFPLRSSGARPAMLCGVARPGRNAPESGVFSKLLYREYHGSTDQLAGGLPAFPSTYLPATGMKHSWKRSSVLGSV